MPYIVQYIDQLVGYCMISPLLWILPVNLVCKQEMLHSFWMIVHKLESEAFADLLDPPHRANVAIIVVEQLMHLIEYKLLSNLGRVEVVEQKFSYLLQLSDIIGIPAEPIDSKYPIVNLAFLFDINDIKDIFNAALI